MPKVPSLDKLFYDFKNSINKYLQREDIILSPGFPITDLMVTLPLQEIRRLYLLLEFLYRTQTPNAIIALLEDSDFIQEFCDRFEITESEFRSMVMDEVVRKAFPYQPSKGTPAYVVMRVQVFTGESSIELGRTDLQLDVAGHIFNLAIPEDGFEFSVISSSGGKYIEVPFYSEDYGFKVTEIVKAGSYYPIKVNSYQNLFDTKGYVVYSIDGEDPESLESFVDRLSIFPRFGYNLSLKDILSNLLKSFGVSDFKIVTYGEPEFSPRPFGIDVWVRVPYISVSYNSENLKIGPDPRSHYSYDAELGEGLPPRRNVLYGSIYDYSNSGAFFNPLIFRIQSFLVSNSIFAGNSLGILIRKADAIYLKKVKLIGLMPKGGYSIDFVISDLKKDLHKFLSNQNIGVSISSSDILRVVLNNKMVDDCRDARFISYSDSPDSNSEVEFNGNSGIDYIKADKVSQYVSVVNIDKFVVEA